MKWFFTVMVIANGLIAYFLHHHFAMFACGMATAIAAHEWVVYFARRSIEK